MDGRGWTVSTIQVIDHDQNRFAASFASSLYSAYYFVRHLYRAGVAAISMPHRTSATTAAAATHVSLFITVIIFINT